MRRWLAVTMSLVIAAICALALVPLVTVAIAPLPANMHVLAEQGQEPRVIAISSAFSLRSAAYLPAGILIEPHTLMHAEQAALDRYVAGGGVVWLVGSDPSSADGLAAGVRTLRGIIVSQEGAAPQASGDNLTFRQGGMHALEAADPAWHPIFQVGETSFRDTTGDGRVDAGEPPGPFVVALERDIGDGKLVVVSLEGGPTVADVTLIQALASTLPRGPVWIDTSSPATVVAASRALDTMLASVGSEPFAAVLLAIGLAGAFMLGFLPKTTHEQKSSFAGPMAWLEAQLKIDPSRAVDALEADPKEDEQKR